MIIMDEDDLQSIKSFNSNKPEAMNNYMFKD
jgi:hypothetical protein